VETVAHEDKGSGRQDKYDAIDARVHHPRGWRLDGAEVGMDVAGRLLGTVELWY